MTVQPAIDGGNVTLAGCGVGATGVENEHLDDICRLAGNCVVLSVSRLCESPVEDTTGRPTISASGLFCPPRDWIAQVRSAKERSVSFRASCDCNFQGQGAAGNVSLHSIVALKSATADTEAVVVWLGCRGRSKPSAKRVRDLLEFIDSRPDALMRCALEEEIRRRDSQIARMRGQYDDILGILHEYILDEHVVIVDHDGILSAQTQQFPDDWPMASGALGGRRIEDVLPDPILSEVRSIIAQLDDKERFAPRDIAVSEGDGDERVFRLSASRVVIEDGGQKAAAALLLLDVTEKTRLERENALLAEVARRTSNMVEVTGTDHRIKWVNAAFEKRTGHTLEEARGKRPGELVQYEGTDPKERRRIREALDQGKPVKGQIRDRSRTGEEYWIAYDIRPLEDSDGRLSGYMAVQTDITESKEKKRQLKVALSEAEAARAETEASRDYLMSSINAMTDGIAVFDEQERLVLWNDAYKKMFSTLGDTISVGTSCETLLRTAIERGAFVGSAGREEELLAELQQRRKAA